MKQSSWEENMERSMKQDNDYFIRFVIVAIVLGSLVFILEHFGLVDTILYSL